MLIDCGGDLFLGDFAACDAGGFDRTIHLWRGRDVAAQQTCRNVLGRLAGPDDLAIRWREEDPIGRIDLPLLQIADFARSPGRLLVHCRSGHCRSANLAILAALARGLDPFAIIDRLNRERFRLTGGLPAWKWADLNQILHHPK